LSSTNLAQRRRTGGSHHGRIGSVDVRISDAVVYATLDRPKVRNAIDADMVTGLSFAVDVAERRHHRLLMIRGAGGSFCAGADLGDVERLRSEPQLLDDFMRRLGEVLDRIEAGSFASLAVVEGHAVAGGLEILLACDLSVAATTARIGDGHVRYGLVPAAGSSVRLTSALTPARSNYLLLTGNLLTGQQAGDWGLVSAVAEPGDLDDVVESIVDSVIRRGRATTAAIKTMTASARERPQPEALGVEREIFGRHIQSDEATAGLAAFRSRGTPVAESSP
jgi:enoyl-CoA hydratase/carnithine racemase